MKVFRLIVIATIVIAAFAPLAAEASNCGTNSTSGAKCPVAISDGPEEGQGGGPAIGAGNTGGSWKPAVGGRPVYQYYAHGTELNETGVGVEVSTFPRSAYYGRSTYTNPLASANRFALKVGGNVVPNYNDKGTLIGYTVNYRSRE